MSANAVIQFEPDGYVLDGPKLMGRQAAGHAFLRAAVAGRGGEPMRCTTPNKGSAAVFQRLVQSLDAKAETQWIPPGRLDLIEAAGAVYAPGPTLAPLAHTRLRAGPAAYSLVGVTHTTASHGALDSIAGLVALPLMPWDALICTSQAVLETVRLVVEAEHDYLAWRLGTRPAGLLPKLPVIPLGVHSGDFLFSASERAAARAALGLADDEVAALFVGRLSYHAKAHPHAMYVGLEQAAKAAGTKLALIQCGWFANEPIERAFKDGAARYAPSVKALFANGKDDVARRRAWAAADLFVSLSDNVQETFGLAPVEAMAAGLPSIVTDWDGYKDTVRDGMDGFRISTTMPEAGAGELYAMVYETGEANYDHYSGLVCRTVSVDMAQLVARLVELVTSPDLRHKLGAAARARATSELDWRPIYVRYKALYSELRERRAAARRDPKTAAWLACAPHAAPARPDPFGVFGHYPTRALTGTSVVFKAPDATTAGYAALAADPMFNYLPAALPGEPLTDAILTALGTGPVSVDALAAATSVPKPRLLLAIGILAKMGVVRIAAGGG